MELECRFFASFREEVGQKTLEWTYDAAAVTAGDLLEDLIEEYPGLDIFEPNGEVRGFVSVMKNGRDITHLEGLDTPFEDGDRLSVFPPVAGG
ncbi:MAG: ubiquitin-like small modifier protein 1 [Halobacteriales archaeon]|nr:ubiquitin-like small modifier protein 1 [Halobacteriales archaeon]